MRAMGSDDAAGLGQAREVENCDVESFRLVSRALRECVTFVSHTKAVYSRQGVATLDTSTTITKPKKEKKKKKNQKQQKAYMDIQS